MPEAVQIVLLITLVAITTVLVVIGVQVYFLIKEVRLVIKKAGDTVEKLQASAHNIISPLSDLSGTLKNVSLLGVVKLVRSFLKK